MDKTYHLVMVIENGTNLLSSDLFINKTEAAQKYFVQKIKENDITAKDEDIEAALGEGYYKTGTTVIMYTEPYNIFGNES